MLLSPFRFHLRNSPGLVKRRPGNDGRVVVILPQHLHPLLRIFLHGSITETVVRRHLAPDQQPFYIRQVQKSLVFHLHMLPDAVEAHFFYPVDIQNKRIHRGRR